MPGQSCPFLQKLRQANNGHSNMWRLEADLEWLVLNHTYRVREVRRARGWGLWRMLWWPDGEGDCCHLAASPVGERNYYLSQSLGDGAFIKQSPWVTWASGEPFSLPLHQRRLMRWLSENSGKVVSLFRIPRVTKSEQRSTGVYHMRSLQQKVDTSQEGTDKRVLPAG